MNTRQKLEIIQKRLGLTQTKLAERFGVSFVAFNNWWTGKATPRLKMQAAIEELFLEVTGQKIIPNEQLDVKKQALRQKSSEHKNVIAEILNNPDVRDQFILKLTYNSNSIEGNTLTEPDTAAVIFDNVALPNKSLIEQLEAKNHQAALNYLFDYILRGKAINEELILKLHGMLMNGIRPDAGAYRNHAVRITGVNLPMLIKLARTPGGRDIRALAGSNVVATLLPGCCFHLGLKEYPPARKLIEAGAIVALATDYNPGTSPTLNMQMILSLACTQMRMTPAEAIAAATINAAYSLGRHTRIGSVEVDKDADLAVFDVADYREIPYYFGVNHCWMTIKRGSVVYGAGPKS